MRSAWASASSSAWVMKTIETPRRLQPLHQGEEVALFLGRQRRRRLVEDDDLGLVVHGAGDLDHLPLGGAEASRPSPSDRP